MSIITFHRNAVTGMIEVRRSYNHGPDGFGYDLIGLFYFIEDAERAFPTGLDYTSDEP